MLDQLIKKRHSLVLKIIASVGVILLASFTAWAFFNIRQYEEKVMSDIAADCDQLSEAILLGTHYAMMFNARDDINQIITNMGRLKGLEHVRIYNKAGQIKFSNLRREVGLTTGIKAEACFICHRTDPPLEKLALPNRDRIFMSEKGNRLLGIISPIYNEPGCAGACHAHPAGKKILGALDVVISLEQTDAHITAFQRGLAVLALMVFGATSAIIFLVLGRFFILPIRRIIAGTESIADGNYDALGDFKSDDEIGGLASAINSMGREIGEKQEALNRQKDEYQRLFELVPCIISVQDRDYRLIGYNREFSDRFDPTPHDYCYSAYKGRTTKCEFCPVEKTFADGQPHFSEETGRNKDGTLTHWLVKTAPMKDKDGNIVGAMEMSLDITHKKQLEDRLAQSEQKYYAIFNSIPSPVFVLDAADLKILDSNDSVEALYGYRKQEVIGRPFSMFFPREDRQRYATRLLGRHEIKQARQLTKQDETRFVHIRVSPSLYSGRASLLVTVGDITDRLETEMQLIQAGKMATLGEMATGVAHELNQPLAVIKTASNFFMKKIRRKQPIPDNILNTMATEIDAHVDRATHIINHLRQFGRKAGPDLAEVRVNAILKRAFDMFSQQLKLKEIEVTWELDNALPPIIAEAGRLEQVFINLLINARDAIEAHKQKAADTTAVPRKITLKTCRQNSRVQVAVCDTGVGIPSAVQDKIFEPFYTTKKVGDGTGIGLSISYGIVKEFGGTIRVTSQPDRGTCFYLNFPVRRPHDN